MADDTLRKPSGVARVFFQEILEGDRRKLEARSNDASTGGGARDLRVPHKAFGPLFAKFFPTPKSVKRRRGGVSTTVEVQSGHVHWVERNVEYTHDVQYEPPTDARGSEGRIAKIHDISVLAERIPPASAGQVFLLLVQEDNGKVFPHYVTLKGLKDTGFNREISRIIRLCASNTRQGRSVRGYIDYVAGKSYCHG